MPFMELVAHMVAGGRDTVREVIATGLEPVHFHDADACAIYKFLVDYIKEYDAFPAVSSIEGETGVVPPSLPPEPLEFFLDKVKEVRTIQHLYEHQAKLGDALMQKNTEAAVDSLSSVQRQLREQNLIVQPVVPLFSLIPLAVQKYNDLKGGLRGVPFPWATITTETLGMWPKDLVVFVARTGVGKTWTLIQLALKAWKEGHKVLFITTEMAQETIVQRFVAMHMRLPYRMLRRGKLTLIDEQRFYEGADELKTATGLDVIGGQFDFRMESIDGAIEESDPELAIIDGAYLIKAPGKTRTERIAEVFNEMKRVGMSRDIAIATSTQFNRDAKSSNAKTNVLENIGLSDVVGWNADLAFALTQSDEMVKARRLGVIPMKGREAKIPPFETNWDFELMDFSEIDDDAVDGLEEDPVF